MLISLCCAWSYPHVALLTGIISAGLTSRRALPLVSPSRRLAPCCGNPFPRSLLAIPARASHTWLDRHYQALQVRRRAGRHWCHIGTIVIRGQPVKNRKDLQISSQNITNPHKSVKNRKYHHISAQASMVQCVKQLTNQ
jgi:hypothetical protein